MSILRSLIVPGWTRIIPGLALCAVFAFVIMNVDHMLGEYSKADLASREIPGLETKLATATEGGDTQAAVSIQKKIDAHRKTLDRVGGKVGHSWSWATFLYETCQVKYVSMLLIGGILICNLFGIPEIFKPGVGVARPLIKPGIIILGVPYVWSDVVRVGGTGLILAAVFIFGTAMLFVMPYLGQALGISQPQFGAWSVVAILNTARLIAAAEWYGEEARNTAVLINAARIMLIPLIVVFAVWFCGITAGGNKGGFWSTMRAKFPVFILGFFLLIVLNSAGIDFLGGPKAGGTPFWAMNSVYKWFFAVGFAGIGLSISIDDMKRAGGAAFLIGSGAATAKMFLGLIVVLLLGTGLLRVTGG